MRHQHHRHNPETHLGHGFTAHQRRNCLSARGEDDGMNLQDRRWGRQEYMRWVLGGSLLAVVSVAARRQAIPSLVRGKSMT